MEENLDFYLSAENLLSESEIENLFQEETDSEEKEEKNIENEVADEPDFSTIEEEVESQESVGDEKKEDITSEETPSTEGNETASSIYSSIAKALQDEGVLLDVDEEKLNEVQTADDFRSLIEQQIKSGLDERQKRIDDALEAGVEPSEIKNYEGSINYLRSIKDEDITDESENGENLRKRLIYQDYINNGFSNERALREVKKSIDSGNDVEDAKEALKSNLQHFEESYKALIDEAKKEKAEFEQQRKKQFEELKSSILDNETFFNDIKVDRNVRQKAYDNLVKPVYKDNEGNALTAIQKYEREHKADFLKNLALVFTMTDGFKNLDGIVKDKVQKEKKKGFAELERVINSTSRNPDGSLRFSTGVNVSKPQGGFKKFDFDV